MNHQNGYFGAFPGGVPPPISNFPPPFQAPGPVVAMIPEPLVDNASVILQAAQLPPPPPPPEKKKKKKPLEKPIEVLCKICNIYCSSERMFLSHCAGRKHQKREKEAKVYGCDICGIYCITAEEQKEHFETPLHEESMKVKEYLLSQQEKSEQEEESNEDSDEGLEKKMLSMEDLNDMKLKMKNKEFYRICDLCNVKANSRQMWEAHVISKKHKAREADQNVNNKKLVKQFSCSICNVLCYTAEEREEHLKSDSHSETLRQHLILKKLAGDTAEEPAAAPSNLPETEGEEASSKAKVKLENEPVVQPVRAGDNTWWFPCDLCGIKTNSMENYKDHINSVKHKSKEKGFTIEKKAQKQKFKSEALRETYKKFVELTPGFSENCKDPSSFCGRCNQQFETVFELEEHFLSEAHRNMQSKRKIVLETEAVKRVAELAKKPKTVEEPTVGADYGYGGGHFRQLSKPIPPVVQPPPVPPPHFYMHTSPRPQYPSFPPSGPSYPPPAFSSSLPSVSSYSQYPQPVPPPSVTPYQVPPGPVAPSFSTPPPILNGPPGAPPYFHQLPPAPNALQQYPPNGYNTPR